MYGCYNQSVCIYMRTRIYTYTSLLLLPAGAAGLMHLIGLEGVAIKSVSPAGRQVKRSVDVAFVNL
jgi:hypothetical protein